MHPVSRLLARPGHHHDTCTACLPISPSSRRKKAREVGAKKKFQSKTTERPRACLNSCPHCRLLGVSHRECRRGVQMAHPGRSLQSRLASHLHYLSASSAFCLAEPVRRNLALDRKQQPMNERALGNADGIPRQHNHPKQRHQRLPRVGRAKKRRIETDCEALTMWRRSVPSASQPDWARRSGRARAQKEFVRVV